jgi:hypothetical protein
MIASIENWSMGGRDRGKGEVNSMMHSLYLRFVLSCFLFHGIVWNGIPRVCLYYCSTEQKSELFFLLRNGSERNSERLLIYGTEFRVVISSAEWLGTEFRKFAAIFDPRNGIPSCFLFCRRVQN